MHALAPVLPLAAEADSGIFVVLPHPAELVWGIVAFAIVFYFFKRFAFPKLNEVLDERARNIQGKLEEADNQLQEAERARRNFEEQLANAKGEADRIIEEGRQTAESLRQDIVAKAEAEARVIVDRAQAEVHAARDRALVELRQEVATLSVQLAGKIVEKEIDARTHEALIDRYIQGLARRN